MAFWDKFKKRKGASKKGKAHNPLAGIPDTWEDAAESKPDVNNDFIIPTSAMLAGIPHCPETDASETNQDSFLSPPPHPDILADYLQTYPLVFYLMEDNVCTRKIDFVCYDHERPDDILTRMVIEEILPQKSGFSYRILYWPTQNGMSTVDSFDSSLPMALGDFIPKSDTVFIIEQYASPEEPIEMHTLYGCPTAALPEQERCVAERSVDTISFD